MKKIHLILLIFIFTQSLSAQKEASNWIFCNNDWLNFNTTPATIMPYPFISFHTKRNMISVSDAEGNLLFFSTGHSLYNRLGFFIETINGDKEKTHPIFSIPKPGSNSSYFILYNSTHNSYFGLNYREMNMDLNMGFGGLEPNVIGTLLEEETDKITTVLHDNLKNIWVVSREMTSNNYLSWLATENGIDSTPVISPVGATMPNNTSTYRKGQIKTNLNGSKIAAANLGLDQVELFDFNQTTGELTNPIILDNLNNPYGIEFSASGKYLYVTHMGTNGYPEILQYNLQAGDAAAISNSVFTMQLPFTFYDEVGGLQLNINEKIYLAVPYTDLGVIHSPDESGTDINFELEGQSISTVNESYGLPSFFHEHLHSYNIVVNRNCPLWNTSFSLDTFYHSIDSMFWDFGDVASGNDNFSNSPNPIHQYPDSGTYIISLTIYSGDLTFERRELIKVATKPLPSEIDLCDNEIFFADVYITDGNYLWSNGSQSSSIEIDSPGIYSVDIILDSCIYFSDTIIVNGLPAPVLELNEFENYCGGLTLDVSNPHNATYIWNTGAIGPVLTLLGNDALMSVTVTNSYGCSEVDQGNYNHVPFSYSTTQLNVSCEGNDDGIAQIFPLSFLHIPSYLWNNGDTTYSSYNLSAGNYTVTISSNLGCSEIQNYTITEPAELIVDFTTQPNNTATSNPDGSITLIPTGGTPPYSYEWDAFGVTDDPTFYGLLTGIYNITITDNNDCEKEVEVTIGSITSTEDLVFLENINLFPNPVGDFIFLKIPEVLSEDLEIKISNTLGQLVSDGYFLKKGKTDFSIEVSNWSSGIYFFKIKLKEEERVWKVFVF